MNEAAPAQERIATRRPALTFARLSRLTLKELKETLRDRRTIVTLVLMPLLVYPLLSLGLRQFLLSSVQSQGELTWLIGFESELERQQFRDLLEKGDKYVERAPSDLPFEKIGSPIPAEGIETAVRDHRIDVGVRLRPRAGMQSSREQPTGEVELFYRPNAPISAAVVDYIERRLQAYNDHYVASRDINLPAAWQLKPAVSAADSRSSLATLVPLVLILMTITGAVYPAIDLTAGERERGTLESLMAAPIPRLGLLIAKYIAVVTVALLTAVVNLTAMTITVVTSGLAKEIFGTAGLSLGGIAAVFALLVLFAAFFSAVLLCITSFARSFKEAQAYLIPLMLVSLGPGFLSLIPGVHLGPVLSITPLANIVLLARDVMAGNVSPLWAAVAVLTTILYGSLALAIAARIFGSDAILYGSQGSWSDLFRRPAEPRSQATPAGALAALAIVAPLFVMLSGALALMHQAGMTAQLLAGGAMLLVLFVAAPLLAANWQGVYLATGFQLRRPSALAVLGAAILGASLAPLAYELIILSQDFGIATITDQQLQDKQPAVEALIAKWRNISPAIVFLALALVPAIAEEFFFRGYLLGALRGRLPAWAAILVTGAVFGLFHASVGGIVAVERVLSSAALGIVLGWVCWTSRSVLPGMILHALNNGLLLSLAYWGDGLKSLGLDVVDQRHLPALWLISAGLAATAGAMLVWFGKKSAVPAAL